MGYQVLARKWRPGVFSELVGQEHVVAAISNGLDNNRLHHAYLFTGTRGVGKTTIARIFSKSLNCEQGMSSTPCGQCATCQEIEQGNFVDLLEIDAASRTKVEDTRDLLDNVQYKPTRGDYKVYLIDEVHMLSKHSFNALLKTLEEPPSHVKFLLATTDPQKLPITILSRCLQFNLKALSRQQIEQQLGHVLQQEGIVHEGAALAQLAKAAQGSMRDALSLTDQAIAQGNNSVTLQVVSDMLGLMDKNQVLKLLYAVLNKDSQGTLQQLEQISYQAPDYSRLLSEIMSLLHQIALTQFVPDACKLETVSPRAIYQLAKDIPPEQVQLLYQIALQGRKDLPHAADGRTGLEMTLLRMLAFRPERQAMSSAEIAGYASKAAQSPHQQPSPQVDEITAEEPNTLFAQQQQLEQQAEQLQRQAAVSTPATSQAFAQVEPQPFAAEPEQPQPTFEVAQQASPPAISSEQEAAQQQPLSEMQRKIALMKKLRGKSDGDGAVEAKKSEVTLLIPDTQPENSPLSIDSPASSASDVALAPVVASANDLVSDSEVAIPEEPAAGVWQPPLDEQSSTTAITAPAEAEVQIAPQIQLASETQTAPPMPTVPQAPAVDSDLPPWLQNTNTSSIDPGLAEFLGAQREPVEQAEAFDATAHLQEEAEYPVDIAIPVFLEGGQKVIASHQLDSWSQLIESMPVAALTKQLALHSAYQIEGDKVTLLLPNDKQHLHNGGTASQLQQALSQVLQRQIELQIVYGDPVNTPFGLQQQINKVRQQHALHIAQTDEIIRHLRDTFDASIVEDSVKAR